MESCAINFVFPYEIFLEKYLLFRPHLWGEELYTQMGFFCSVNFGRSIYSSYRNVSGIIKRLLQLEFKIKKIFLWNFVFFEELSSFKFLCEHAIFAWFFSLLAKFLFKLSSSIKILFRNYISLYRLKQFCVTNRPIKRLVLVSWGSLLSKKCRIQFESCFFEKFRIYYCFSIT